MNTDRTTLGAVSATHDENLDLRGLVRLGAWGAVAVTALLLAVFATRSDLGARRMAAALGQPAPVQQAIRLQADPSPVTARTAELEFETRQLGATVRSLSTDRDRLLARVTVLERSLEDVTGSIARSPARALPPEPASRPDPMAKTEPATRGENAALFIRQPLTGPSMVATISSPLTIPAPSPEALARIGLTSNSLDDGNTATRTEFGVDIGGGANVTALRNVWAAARRSHDNLFDGLYPVITVRDGTRPGSVELRLIVGPLGNAAAAARLCGTLANVGISCQPAIFDGQRLALR